MFPLEVLRATNPSGFLSISYLHKVTMRSTLSAADPIHHLAIPRDDPPLLSTTTIEQNGQLSLVFLDPGPLGLHFTPRSLSPCYLHLDKVSHIFVRILHCHMPLRAKQSQLSTTCSVPGQHFASSSHATA